MNLAPIATSGLASDATTEPITASSSTVAVTGTNVADQIESLATTLKGVQNNASKYKMVQLSAAEIAQLPSPSNIKEAYKVVSFQGEETQQTVYTQVGDTIKIYKDSSLSETYLGSDADTVDSSTGVVTKYTYQLISDPTTKITDDEYEALSAGDKELYEPINSQSLNFVYQLTDGTYELVKVDVSKFLSESEFGDGLIVNGNGVVSINVDTESADAEDFITVGPDGLKISGIQDAIDSSLEGINNDLDELDRVVAEALNDLETRKAEKTDLDTLNSDILEEVEAGNGIQVSAKSAKKQTVSLKLDSSADNVLTLSANGLYLSEIDCGEY